LARKKKEKTKPKTLKFQKKKKKKKKKELGKDGTARAAPFRGRNLWPFHPFQPETQSKSPTNGEI
jgi:hypothetical protein